MKKAMRDNFPLLLFVVTALTETGGKGKGCCLNIWCPSFVLFSTFVVNSSTCFSDASSPSRLLNEMLLLWIFVFSFPPFPPLSLYMCS